MSKYIFFLIFISFSIKLVGQVNFKSSNLPIVVINTNGNEIVDEPRIIVHMGIINNQNSNNKIDYDFNDYDGLINIEIRGTTSQSYPKKQYALETQHEDGTTDNVSILGFPKENDWILHGPYSDKTLMRNYLSSNFANQMGFYAPRMQFCELVLNNEYMGIYIFCESIKRDKNRINISEMKEGESDNNDVTGGYIFKIDRADESRFHWNTNVTKTEIICEYPKMNVLETQHISYVKSLINNFELALFSDNFSDAKEGYLPYVDLNTFVDFFIINELSKNIDAYKLSTYFYKDCDDIDNRLKMGPVWDFNIAYGNVDYREGYVDSGFIATQAPWWNRLLEDSTFNNTVKDRWVNLRNGQFLKQNIYDKIDSIAMILDKAIDRNFSKWDIIGDDIWPNYFIGDSYKEEIDYLKDWFDTRISWLDYNLPGKSSLVLPYEKFNYKLYPSPFKDFLKLELELKEVSNVTLVLYNSQGSQIGKLIDNEVMQTGIHKLEFNTNNLPGLHSKSICLAIFIANGKIIDSKKIFYN